MKQILERLVRLAAELDEVGLTAYADKVDELLHKVAITQPIEK